MRFKRYKNINTAFLVWIFFYQPLTFASTLSIIFVSKIYMFQVDVEKDRLSDLMSWLAIQLKPRYHFVPSSEKYFERQPYRFVEIQFYKLSMNKKLLFD